MRQEQNVDKGKKLDSIRTQVANETYQRILDAPPGSVVYWEGTLDRSCEAGLLERRARAQGARLGALHALNTRIASLVQRRLTPDSGKGDGTFAYIAQRNRREPAGA